MVDSEAFGCKPTPREPQAVLQWVQNYRLGPILQVGRKVLTISVHHKNYKETRNPVTKF